MALATCDSSLLGAFKPKGVGNDPPSLTQRPTILKVFGTDEQLAIAVYTNTKVIEVKQILSFKLGIEPGQLRFNFRQGTLIRQNLDMEEVSRNVTIHGIKSFRREKKAYPHPHCIIGAGHNGLKMAMTFLMEQPEAFTNFILYDRRPEVGGTSWWQQANHTTRLQTEVGVYHLEYHERNGWPETASEDPWPSRDKLLAHFKEVSEKFGILPYCQMNTNVTKLNIIGKDYWEQMYELVLDRKGDESIARVASVALFPGNLTNPKRNVYKGEENFEGHIVYGISSEFDYSDCAGNVICIVGSGAFSVENVRTCVEYQSKKIYMVSRRKSMAMPRIVSWLINQSMQFISAALTLEAMAPMYDMIGVDQWAYYSVYSNEARTNVTIRQASRFGIGDVYFLSQAMGLTEHIVDDIKRVSQRAVHLVNGRTLENVSHMLKLLGFHGEFENDRLLKIKDLFGFWANKDYRRYCVAEPIGVDANNFGGTSFSPGAISWSENQIHLLHYPKDWVPIMEAGAMPSHLADESIDRPAYVVEARHGALTGITLGAMVPGIAERGNVVGPLSNQRMWQIHPVEQFLVCARKEWDDWGRMIRDAGHDKPVPPYPYTVEMVKSYLDKEYANYRSRG